MGDKIKKINGIDVTDGAEFTRAVMQSPASIQMTIKRPNGQTLELTTQLNGPKQRQEKVNYPTRIGVAKSILLQTGLVIEELSQPVGVKVSGVIANSVASKIQAESLPGAATKKVSLASCGAITHINSHRVKTLADADRVVSNEWERMKQNNLPKLLILNLIDHEGQEYMCHFSD